MLIDHALLRIFWTNFYPVTEGVWRSNHPSPKRIEKYAKKGIRAILNLRGPSQRSDFVFEREACEKVGIELHTVQLSARSAFPRANYLALLDKFETIPHPFVLHCKSGADRAGLASALYLIHMKGVPVAEARKQLSFKYLHVERFKTGLMGYILDQYAKDSADTDMTIRQWFETYYDPDTITAGFEAQRAQQGQ